MLTDRRRRRLAARAHGFGWRARRAVAALQEAAVGGDLAAARALGGTGRQLWLDEVWEALLRADPKVGQHLLRRYRPGRRALSHLVMAPAPDVLSPEMHAGVVAAAALDHPIGGIAQAKLLAAADPDLLDEACQLAERHERLAGFCRTNGVHPTDPAANARFLLLTDRFDEYRAVDPEGTLLRTAYDTASDDDQAAIRAAALRHGAPELLHSLVGRGKNVRIDALAIGELDRLGRALAHRNDFPRLWELVTAASVVEAVELVRYLEPRWRPPTEQASELLAALRSADPDVVASVHENPTLVARFDVGGRPSALAVAPDLRQIAVARRDGSDPQGRRSYVSVHDLASGPLDAYLMHNEPWISEHLAHLGDGVVLFADTTHGLVRYADGDREVLDPTPVDQLAGAAGRYIACTREHVRLGDRADTAGRLLRYADLRLPDPASHERTYCCADGDGSRFAVGTGSAFAVIDTAGEVIATTGNDLPAAQCTLCRVTFSAPDELVTTSAARPPLEGPLHRWRMAGTTIVPAPENERQTSRDAVGLPGQRRVAAIVGMSSPYGVPRLTLLDSTSLRSAGRDENRHQWPAPAFRLAPAGAHGIAVAYDHVALHDLQRTAVRRLLGQPVATMRPADLAVVAALDERSDDPVLRLLRTCLQYRFGGDVTLGTATSTPTAGTDIMLSGSED